MSNIATYAGISGNPFTGVFGTGKFMSFSSSGTFTIPSGITSVRVRLWGSGVTGFANGHGGYNGGGGGGFAMKTITGLTPGGTVAVTVSPSSASTTSFGAYVSATGGGGSTGGTGSGGDINNSGGTAYNTAPTNPAGSGGAGAGNLFGKGGSGTTTGSGMGGTSGVGGSIIGYGGQTPGGCGLFSSGGTAASQYSIMGQTIMPTACPPGPIAGSMDFIGTGGGGGGGPLNSSPGVSGGGGGGNYSNAGSAGGFPGGGGGGSSGSGGPCGGGFCIIEY